MGSEIRIGDQERHLAVAFLRDQCEDGLLTLDEFGERASQALAATTSTELDVLVADLAPPSPGGLESPARRPVRVRLSIFGSGRHSGPASASGHTVAVAIFGTLTIDLRDAVIDPWGVSIHAFAVFGGVTVIVPEDVEVDCSAIGIFGTAKGASSGAVVSPVRVRVDGAAIFGGIKAKVRTRKLRKGRPALPR
jgi:hypothetical protein